MIVFGQPRRTGNEICAACNLPCGAESWLGPDGKDYHFNHLPHIYCTYPSFIERGMEAHKEWQKREMERNLVALSRLISVENKKAIRKLLDGQ